MASTAQSQPSYPGGVGTIRIIVPFAAGGASDVVGRLLADYLSKRWNVPAVLENVPGGGATVGIGRVASGPKDGSQILILPIPFVTTRYLVARLPYDPDKDIAPLVQLTRQPSLLCVAKELPVSTVAELIAYAKANPDKLNYASSGAGSPGHLSAELLKGLAGIEMKHIPFTGSAPAQNALVGGHVDLFIDNAAAIIGLVRSGAVKCLAVTTPARSALIPDFPTIAETIPGYAVTGWLGAAVSGGTPDAVQDSICAACNAFLNDNATVEKLSAVTSEPVGGTTAAFLDFLAGERARWETLIQRLGLRA
jgi:tripartite-type tricarboxylate transporter receptor subunit TctC